VQDLSQGRDLTGEKWLSTLKEATNQVPLDETEAKSWQDTLLTQSRNVPYPVDYESNTDLDWFIHSTEDEIKRKIILVWPVYFLYELIKSGLYNLIKYLYFKVGYPPQKDVNWLNLQNKPGRIFVKFNGLKKNISNPEFYICCDSCQFHYFQRFCQDWQVWHDNETTYSSALFVVRSARLLWQERKGKGAPWKVHRLMLQCSIDTQLWTQEETELVRSEKIAQAENTIRTMEQKGDLTEKQLSHLQRERTQRQRLNQSFPHCPSKPLYQGKSNIIVGVSLGLKKPVTVAVVDVVKNEVLAYRSIRQLLGKNYNLVNRKRRQQQRLSHERHKAQKRNAPNSFGESELGKYLDRLLADAIIAIAKTYQAESIVLPQLRNIREQMSSEIRARAEEKCPGYKEGQKKYAKEYQISIHYWSYGRLIENIKSQAAQAGISTEICTQSITGSPQEKAKNLAIFTYQERIMSLE
jgi:hypothetical protein